MKTIITLLFLAWSLLAFSTAFCQQFKYVSFDSTERKFGAVDANQVAFAEYTFKFRNLSSAPVQVVSARSESPLVAATGIRGLVQPDRSGSVLVTFDVRRQSGSFSEDVVVEIGRMDMKTGEVNLTETQKVVLKLSGTVKARKQGPADWYPYKQGNLWFSKQLISFGNVNDRDRFADTCTIYNGGKNAIKLQEIATAKGFELEGWKAGKELAAGDSIRVITTLNGPQVGDYDWINQQARLKTTDDTLSEKLLRIHATLMPAFPKMSREDSAKAPKIVFEKTAHNFGPLNGDKSVTFEFKFKNHGRSDLKILKVQTSCGCTVAASEKNILKPDEKSSIRVTFNPEGRKGTQVKQVRIITNDPSTPLTQLTIQAQIGADSPDPGGGE